MKTLKNMTLQSGTALLLLAAISACVQLDASEVPSDLREGNEDIVDVSNGFTRCTIPRPEICYELYQPVCAVKDTGIRCITTPCPSAEKMTYANDCKACADQRVLGFQRGDCDAINTTVLDRYLNQ